MRPLLFFSILALSHGACADESPPSCKGEPTICPAFSTSTTCIAQFGCDPTGDECLGVARPCSLLSHVDCEGQAGCLWSSSSNTCNGTAWTCDIQFDQTECSGQMGCYWSPLDCGGTPHACEEFTTAEGCTAQDGCAWTQ